MFSKIPANPILAEELGKKYKMEDLIKEAKEKKKLEILEWLKNPNMDIVNEKVEEFADSQNIVDLVKYLQKENLEELKKKLFS